MPKNKVTDPITDQEIVFARLILSGKMSDQQAAEVAGLNPTTAAYTKAKPRVRAWMDEHRAATQKQILDQEAENLRRKSAIRERVLDRLWEIADLSHDITRGSMASQVKVLAMIIAIEGLIPDRRAASAQKAVLPPVSAKIYEAEWLRKQNTTPQAAAALYPGEDEESEPIVLQAEHTPEAPDPSPEPGPNSNPADSTIPDSVTFAEASSSPYTSFVPDTRTPFTLPKNPFGRWRR